MWALLPRKARPHNRVRVLTAESRQGHDSVEFNFCGKGRKQFILNFAQGVRMFSEGGHSLEMVRGTKLIIRAVNANSRGLMTMHT